ncbi:MAG: hypothetical protein EBY22_09530 [Gammaproteobacteria bacterium]|jgi:DNA-directed RNA polymerase subunit RPC12/RpoP|nr:hypothetical protein [Gammaproteobacteria bacterium]
MDYRCQHCNANLDSGDIFEYFLLYYSGDQKKALKAANEYGWSEMNKLHFNRSIIIQPDRKEQYVICPECKQKDPFKD